MTQKKLLPLSRKWPEPLKGLSFTAAVSNRAGEHTAVRFRQQHFFLHLALFRLHLVFFSFDEAGLRHFFFLITPSQRFADFGISSSSPRVHAPIIYAKFREFETAIVTQFM